jgi:hypothetical protein
MGIDEQVYEAAEELIEASRWEGCETGEAWDLLGNMWSRRDYLSEAFQAALSNEILRAHLDLKNNYEYVEEEITRTARVKELRYKHV